MRPFSACLLLVAAYAQAGTLPGSTEQISKWEAFKSLHGKSHAVHEEHSRFQRFVEADADIQAHNERFEQGLESFSRQHNQYTDLSAEEFSKSALGFVPAVNASDIPQAPQMPSMPSAPASFDWLSQGRMTPMRNQLYCGSCYAFAGLAVAEAYVKGKTGASHDMSEQEQVDCSYKKYMSNNHNGGCQGGWPTAVFQHLAVKDMLTEAEYPYTSGNSGKHGACLIPNRKYNTLSSMRHVQVRPATEDQMAEILYQKGPLVIAMVADNEDKRLFQDLKDGVFDMDVTIRKQPNHAVALVGYGFDAKTGKKYWLIKNSWGTAWGMGGYGKIAYGKNMCNLMMYGVWYAE